jgi:hypothetical protein
MPSALDPSNDDSFNYRQWDDDRPELPQTSPSWYTWIWVIFAFLVMVLTIVGLSLAGT